MAGAEVATGISRAFLCACRTNKAALTLADTKLSFPDCLDEAFSLSTANFISESGAFHLTKFTYEGFLALALGGSRHGRVNDTLSSV